MRTAIVTATIEYRDGRVEYRTFTAETSIARLKQRIKERWGRNPDVAHVGCGNGIYRNSYGAH